MKIPSRDNTSKKKIIKNIFQIVGIPSSYAGKIIDDIVSLLTSGVRTSTNVKIKNFGTFSLKKKSKRIGRNRKSKISYEILERNVLTFKSAIELIKKVNIDVKK